MARTGTPRSTAQAFVDQLNAVLSRTVTDGRLSLLAVPGGESTFEITRFAGDLRAPLELLGSPLSLFVRHTVVVADGHCRTESYGYRLQSSAEAGAFANGGPTSALHIPTSRVPLESVLWHAIAEWGVTPRSNDWQRLLGNSAVGFNERRTAR